MKKVSVIAQCLINEKSFNEMSEAESRIKQIFGLQYADHSFDEWNTEVSLLSAKRFISVVANSSKVRIRALIQELWHY
ncbi:DNA-binding protein [Candidatus Williamhamiltonella defendens]|uniref:DNA-binding protein n=3 Tax=Candidatus Williamhamiltonella defendens TaxID=138072 RepID=A0A249DZE1_9ENTR|nr:hypothetical protein [Candidatus Hamiltonella defensa]ACQ67257.1 hypothetical protein HDEF_0503 [Candidatus Hamiltonella defensa 5AT (Acyrthosiphon pisum)]ASV33745.1 DNA-binding protein [Candidatus Hamiltonella defensa]ASX26460.1 DNA-binding protein [Candidatus Hamiltonella defensa (Bemisia tabaci)]ATW22006.1 DNA-binding protein [Candidatus Hamiltonella defensa]ATW29263.1 DNA-binding protein [Candidatus Hamiltonella defensa]